MPKAKRVKTDMGAAAATPRRSGRIAAMVEAEAASNAPAATSTAATKAKDAKKDAGGKAAGGKIVGARGGKTAGGGKGKPSAGSVSNETGNSATRTTVTTASPRTADSTAKLATKKTKADRKANAGKKTGKKTAKSTIKTPEKAKAVSNSKKASTAASIGVKRNALATAKTGDMDKARKNAMSTLETNVKLAPAAKSEVKTQPASPTPPTEGYASRTATAIANTPKDTIDPNRPIFYPSYFPHIMTSIITMCADSERLKFRGVSRWCQEETHRIVLHGARNCTHATAKTEYHWYRGEFTNKRRFLVKHSSNEIRRRLEWTIQIVDIQTPFEDRAKPFASYPDSRLLFAHTVRYYLEGPAPHVFFPPNLQTVIIFFDPHHGCCQPAPPTAHLVHRTSLPALPINQPSLSAQRSRLPNPAITKVVINVPVFKTYHYPASSLLSTCLDRIIEAILACPATVSNLTVVFSALSRLVDLSTHLLKFWDKLIEALSTKTHATITLVDIAAVFPRTPKRWDRSTFPAVHASINTKYQRRTRSSNLQLTAMTHEEYKAKVGEQQYKIDTSWSSKVMV